MISKKVPLICPACELYPMGAVAKMKARCSECGFELRGEMLKTLLEILSLPEGLGTMLARSAVTLGCGYCPMVFITARLAVELVTFGGRDGL